MEQTYHLLPYPQPPRQDDFSNVEGSVGQSRGSSLHEQFNRSPSGYEFHGEREAQPTPEPTPGVDDQAQRELEDGGPHGVKGSSSTVLLKENSASKPVLWNGLPWCRFFGDVIGILLSICFLGGYST